MNLLKLPEEEKKDTYPEEEAVIGHLRARSRRIRPELVMDLHCPWLYSGPTNERIYFVGQKSQK